MDPLQRKRLVLAGLALQEREPATVEGDVAASAEHVDTVDRAGLAEPREAGLAVGARLLQLGQQRGQRVTLLGRRLHDRDEVLLDEQVVLDEAIDGLGDLGALGPVGDDVEAAALGLLIVPRVEDGEAVEAFLQGVAQLAAALVVQAAVLFVLDAPLAGEHDGAGDDQADAGSKTFEREHEMSLANNARDMLEQVQHALHRIEHGTYGICESCGNAIGKMRLQAFPRATLCMSCKQAEERY